MTQQQQYFQGVIFNLTYFSEIEDELFNYQLQHPEECIPLMPFFSSEHTQELDKFYVSNLTAAKSFDDYMFNVRMYGFPTMINNFIAKHPQYSNMIVEINE